VGVWLVSGPRHEYVRYFVDKITCVCTDNGIEMTTIELPNLLDAFFLWVCDAPLGSLRPHVRRDERLLRHAIRLTGWSHCFGNIMRGCAQIDPAWLGGLQTLRALCKFGKKQDLAEARGESSRTSR
jgi:hypothetical protein